jgi:hypothetical protein
MNPEQLASPAPTAVASPKDPENPTAPDDASPAAADDPRLSEVPALAVVEVLEDAAPPAWMNPPAEEHEPDP